MHSSWSVLHMLAAGYRSDSAFFDNGTGTHVRLEFYMIMICALPQSWLLISFAPQNNPGSLLGSELEH
jgi:hypothetical protein